MSNSADGLFDSLFRALDYDKLSPNQLMVKLLENNLKIKTLKEELVEVGASRDSLAKGLDDLKKKYDITNQELQDARDTHDMLEGVIDHKQQINQKITERAFFLITLLPAKI